MLLTLTPRVKRTLRRCGVPERDVPDQTQAVIVSVLDWWSKRCIEPDAEALDDARAYMTVTARNTAFKYHRHHHRRDELSDSEDALHRMMNERRAKALLPWEPSPEELVLAAEAHAEVSSEVDLDVLAGATTPPQWRAFYEHAVLDVPVSVIAAAERVPVPTIYNRIRLARKDLRASILRRRAAKRG